jgi:hypothetical protein
MKDGKPVLHHSGRKFLSCIAGHADKIDGLRARIDLGYAKLGLLRGLRAKPLGLGPAERIPDEHRDLPGKPAALVHGDGLVRRLLARFFRLLDQIQQLKELRRDTYRKIGAAKGCWFGWLSTREAETAMALNAAVVRENATFVAVPTDDPKYRGRTFNKMVNNGARALYEAIASAKLAWLGIPESRIPSWFTSLADLVASTVEGTKRNGERVTDASGREWRADEHAGLTIAAWLLLRARNIVAATNGVGAVKDLSPLPL